MSMSKRVASLVLLVPLVAAMYAPEYARNARNWDYSSLYNNNNNATTSYTNSNASTFDNFDFANNTRNNDPYTIYFDAYYSNRNSNSSEYPNHTNSSSNETNAHFAPNARNNDYMSFFNTFYSNSSSDSSNQTNSSSNDFDYSTDNTSFFNSTVDNNSDSSNYTNSNSSSSIDFDFDNNNNNTDNTSFFNSTATHNNSDSSNYTNSRSDAHFDFNTTFYTPPNNVSNNSSVLESIVDLEAFSADLGHLLTNNPLMSDLTLVAANRAFRVHRVVLAARSPIFAQLIAALNESTTLTIDHYLNTTADALHSLLTFVYTGRVAVVAERLGELSTLARHFELRELERRLRRVDLRLDETRVCALFETLSRERHHRQLAEQCARFMDARAVAMLARDEMLALSARALASLIARDSFCAPEMALVQFVERWQLAAKRRAHLTPSASETDGVMRQLRLSALSMRELNRLLVSTRRASALVLDTELIIDAIEAKHRDEEEDAKEEQQPGFAARKTLVVTENGTLIRAECRALVRNVSRGSMLLAIANPPIRLDRLEVKPVYSNASSFKFVTIVAYSSSSFVHK